MSSRPTRLVLLGHPVSHSLSPAFQNAALSHAGIHLQYEALDVPPTELRQTFARLAAEGVAGNVTIPYKESIAGLCDRLTPEARAAGAVNTFMLRDGATVGHNTDVAGVRTAARALLGSDPSGLTIGLFGAGGAAAAVLAAAQAWKDCRVIVANRAAERAVALTERFGSAVRVGDAGEIGRLADLVVNATSLGLRGDDPGPIAPADLRDNAAVLDLVYSPTETALVRAARARGLRATDGMAMLIAQGATAFQWWLGVAPDTEVMWRAVGRERPKGFELPHTS